MSLLESYFWTLSQMVFVPKCLISEWELLKKKFLEVKSHNMFWRECVHFHIFRSFYQWKQLSDFLLGYLGDLSLPKWSFPALSVYLRVEVSRSASATDNSVLFSVSSIWTTRTCPVKNSNLKINSHLKKELQASLNSFWLIMVSNESESFSIKKKAIGRCLIIVTKTIDSVLEFHWECL